MKGERLDRTRRVRSSAKLDLPEAGARDQAHQWFPELVSWNVSNSCNLRCSHCYLDAGKRGPAELSFDEGRDFIDQLAAAGTQMLILTGGEPLMRRDIFDLAAHAFSKGLLVVLGTNGMLLNSEGVRKLAAAGVAGAGISLDSLHAEKHDGFRGVPGAWEGAVRGIRNCVDQGLPVLLQMTALGWNYGEVEDMVEFASGEGVSGFTLYFLVCTGRGEELSDITPQQYEEALASLVEAQKRYPQMMVRARCAPHIGRIASQQSSALVANAGCLAARQYCRITPEGDVTPCPYLPIVAGSIRDRAFNDIWQDSPIFTQLRDANLEGKCGRCDFQELCGGCRARAFALTGSVSGEDSWCAYQPPEHVIPRQDDLIMWTVEAEERLQRIPSFIRKRVRVAVEQNARQTDINKITPTEIKATLETLGRGLPFKRPH